MPLASTRNLLPGNKRRGEDVAAWLRVWLRVVVSIYLITTVPWRLSFLQSFNLSQHHVGFVILDLLSTLFFSFETAALAKMIQRTRSARSVLPTTERGDVIAVVETGRNVPNEDVRLRLIFLTFSLMATLPLEYVATIFVPSNEVAYFLLNRLLRIFCLPGYLRDLSTRLARKGRLTTPGVQRTLFLFFVMALAGHLCGCGFFLVAKTLAEGGARMTWPEALGIYSLESAGGGVFRIKMEASVAEAYIQSLYWAYITLVTTGFGDIVPLHMAETRWCIFSTFIGVIITAFTIGNLQRTIGQVDEMRLGFQRKIEMVKQFMHFRNLPAEAQERVSQFYDYRWKALKGADEERFLLELPRSLQQQVGNFLCRDLVASLPILRKANRSLLNAIVECCELNIYSPGDEIVKAGEKIKGAVLVSNGEVEVRRGRVAERKLKRLDRWSEECLVVDKVSAHSVQSVGFSEVIIVPRKALLQIIKAQCSDDFVAQLRESANSLSKTSKASKMFGSADEVAMKGFYKHCHPKSFFRKMWNCFKLLGFIFYVFSIPLSFMYLLEDASFAETPVLLSSGYFVDAFFVVDAILSWNYFFVMEDGLVVSDNVHIRQHFYKQNILPVEIVRLAPFDIISAFFGGRFCHFFRMIKLLQVPTLLSYIESVDVMLSELKVVVDLALYRVFKLNVLLLCICHVVGCLWFMTASVSREVGFSMDWRRADESDELLFVSHHDFGGFAAYLRSVYWAIVGMSTVGYGDIVPTNLLETTFATFTILFGGLVIPAVVGGLAAYISTFHLTAKMFRKRVARTRQYLQRICVSEQLVDNISRYYDYIMASHGGVVEGDVMAELPVTVRSTVSSHINGAALHALPFLSRCDETTLQALCLLLQPRIFLPSDIVLKEGEQGFEMYLIKHGTVTVTTTSVSGVLRILSSGDFVGEGSLLGSSLSEATVTAQTYCEFFSLSHEDFDDALLDSSVADLVKIDLANHLIRARTRNKRASENLCRHPKALRIAIGSAESSKAVASELTGSLTIRADSLLLLTWDVLLLGICVYNAWMIPFRLAFAGLSRLTLTIDWILDLFFLVDMVLRYRFVSFEQGGELVTDPTRISRNYLANRFLIDFISTVPFDMVVYLLLPREPWALVLEELLRILKLIRLGRHFGTLESLFLYLHDHGVHSLSLLKLVEFLSGVIMIAHWAACGFFVVARWKSDQNECSLGPASEEAAASCLWDGTWIGRQIHDGKLPKDGGTTWQLYLRSFNWALPTLVVVVIGDVVPTTSPETLYAFLWMAVGVTVNAAIVGNVANIVANLETDSAEFNVRVEGVRSYLQKHRLSYELESRCDDFHRYLWTAHSGSTDEDAFLDELPCTLQGDIVEQTRAKHIRGCPFFDGFSNDVVKSLALCLQPKVYCAGDLVVHAGDYGQSMFFLASGTVNCFSNEAILATLGPGTYFGETALFRDQPRTNCIMAISFCDCFELSKSDLVAELQRRGMDLADAEKWFEMTHSQNRLRNKNVQRNILEAQDGRSKLSRLISTSSDTKAKPNVAVEIFMPLSGFRYLWDVATLLFTLASLVREPYRQAFSEEVGGSIDYIGLLGNTFFVVDTCMRASQFPPLKGGMAGWSRSEIFRSYRRDGFFLDVLASLSVFSAVPGMSRLQLLNLFRIFRVSSMFEKMREHLSLRGSRIRNCLSLLCKIIFFYIMANHWVACAWFAVHRYLERNEQVTWATADCPFGGEAGSEGCLARWDTTLGEHNICDTVMFNCYTRSLHFALITLSTVGYGDIYPTSELETVWQNMVVLLGACFLAALIGAFGAFLNEHDTLGSNAFKSKIKKLEDYLCYRNVPDSIKQSILFYHATADQGSEMLSLLPEPLQMDISFAVKHRAIWAVPILKSLPPNVQKRLTHRMSHQVYSSLENPVVYSQGDIGWEIYFIVSGVVSVTLPNDAMDLDETGRSNSQANRDKFVSLGSTLSVGNHVGENCITSRSGVRQESIHAMTKRVELFVLSKDDLNDICRLMGDKKGTELKCALLQRNGSSWHSFAALDDLEGDSDTGPRRKQKSRNSPFPLSTPSSGRRTRRYSQTCATQRRPSFQTPGSV